MFVVMPLYFIRLEQTLYSSQTGASFGLTINNLSHHYPTTYMVYSRFCSFFNNRLTWLQGEEECSHHIQCALLSCFLSQLTLGQPSHVQSCTVSSRSTHELTNDTVQVVHKSTQTACRQQSKYVMNYCKLLYPSEYQQSFKDFTLCVKYALLCMMR